MSVVAKRADECTPLNDALLEAITALALYADDETLDPLTTLAKLLRVSLQFFKCAEEDSHQRAAARTSAVGHCRLAGSELLEGRSQRGAHQLVERLLA